MWVVLSVIVCSVPGFQARAGSHVGAGPVNLTLRLEVQALTPAAQAAVDAAGPPEPFKRPVSVEVDGSPCSLVLILSGTEVPMKARSSLGNCYPTAHAIATKLDDAFNLSLFPVRGCLCQN